MPSVNLTDVLHDSSLPQRDKLLIILAEDIDKPKTAAEIKRVAVSSGLRAAQKWNISSVLADKDGRAVHVDEGWKLTSKGQDYLRSKQLLTVSIIINTANDLRQHLIGISDANTKNFVEEAVNCLEAGLLRSAVVFSWVGAIALIYDHIVKHHLNAFNVEAKRRDAKWRDATTADELARIKEHDFLDVAESISVLGKNVKQELQNSCLKLRNACGHPNSLEIGQNRVAAHIEVLIQNVFSKF